MGAFKQMSDIQKRPSHNSGFDPGEDDDEEAVFDSGGGGGSGAGVSERVNEVIAEQGEEEEESELGRGSVRVHMAPLCRREGQAGVYFFRCLFFYFL